MLGLVVRHMAGQRLRALFTALGIGLAVLALVGLTCLADGARRAWSGTLARAGADVLVYEFGALDPFNGALDMARMSAVASLDGVADVEPVVMRLTAFDPGDVQTVLVGRRPGAMARDGARLVAGAWPDPDRRGQAVLGVDLARKAGVGVGDTVRVLFQAFTVIGVAQTGDRLGDHAVHITLTEAADLLYLDGAASFFAVTLDPEADPATVARHITRRLEGVSASPRLDAVADNQILALMDILAWSVAVVALLTGAALAATTMMMNVAERRPDLALLKCLGWSHRRVVGLVLLEAAVLGLVAGTAGTALGFAAALVIGSLDGVASFFAPRPSVGLAVVGIGAALATSLAGALLPALGVLALRPAVGVSRRRL